MLSDKTTTKAMEQVGAIATNSKHPITTSIIHKLLCEKKKKKNHTPLISSYLWHFGYRCNPTVMGFARKYVKKFI